jgi:hypothetical protein
MLQSRKNKRYYWLGLISISILFIAYYSLVSKVPFYRTTVPRPAKHAFNILVVLLVYALGQMGLKRFKVDWINFIWKGLHVAIIIGLIFVASYDWITGWSHLKNRHLIFLLKEVNLSLIAYVCFGILIPRLPQKKM